MQLELRDKLFQHQESAAKAKYASDVVLVLMKTICGIFVFIFLTPACFQCPVWSHASCTALQFAMVTILVLMDTFNELLPFIEAPLFHLPTFDLFLILFILFYWISYYNVESS